MKNSILIYGLFAWSCSTSLIAQDGSWLLEQQTKQDGVRCSTTTQTIQVWFDMRNFPKSKLLPFLICNNGPGDIFVNDKVFWVIKSRGDNSVQVITSSLPRKYSLLSPSNGGANFSSIALLTASGFKIPRKIEINNKQKFVLILEVIERSSGKSHLIDVEFNRKN